MNQRTKFWIKGITLWWFATISPAQAQVTSDGTLSTKVKTTNNRDFTITSGNRAGANLFHSFSQFSVPTEGTVVFNNTNDVLNIIGRVTGSTDSKIDGLLQTKGTANLFLLNPNGIIFGPNASLDIGGSFLASTATSLNFADGSQFGVITPQTTPLLSVSVPTGLQFGASAGNVGVEASFLEVPSGKTLALVGGNVSVEGGILQTLGGRVELGGAAGGGIVGLIDGDDLRLNFPDSIGRADVSLTDGAQAYVIAPKGGSIAINAQTLNISESNLFAGLEPGLEPGSVDAQAGDITLNATEAITIKDSNIFNDLDPNTEGKGGDIKIQTKSLSLTDGASLRNTTSGQGDAGRISVRAGESVSLNDGFIFSTVNSQGKGKGGNIAITTGFLLIQDGAQLNSGTNGNGNAGNILIRADESVSLKNNGAISSTVSSKGKGKAGNINLTTGLLSVERAQLNSGTNGNGNAGNILIRADESVSLKNNGAISSTVSSKGKGKAGNINLTTGSLLLTDRAQLSASTRGQGDAGNVKVNTDTIFLDGVGSLIGAYGAPSAVLGNAGDIDVKTRLLSVTGGAAITTSTLTQGNAGRVKIKADKISLEGKGSNGFSSGVFSFVGGEAKGNGGNINITTESFSVENGAVLGAFNDARDSQGVGGNIILNTKTFEAISGGQILTTTRGPGKAGNITLNATGSVILDGSDPGFSKRFEKYGDTVVFNSGPNSGLFANTSAKSPVDEETPTGPGGNLRINTWQLTVQDGAEVSTSTAGSGQGGILTITAPESITLSGKGGLFAQATADGNAGSLTINTRQLTVQDGAEISNATTSGKSGNIKLDLNSLQVSNGEISASTATGQAGSLSIDAAESVELSGKGGLSVEATKGGTAGSMVIDTEQLTIQAGAAVTVSSPTGQAGNLSITANTLRLDQGSLTAQTGAKPDETDTGANINLYNLDLLLLQNDSLISANATGNANGGNISIKNAANGYIIAIPSEDSGGTTNASDIIANASEGRGGNIEIETQGIFGIQERRAIPGNKTNDIDASSEFGVEGNVTINTPDVDPDEGLVTLPEEVIDTSGLIAQGCPAGVGLAASKFVLTGRGGLPPAPRETVSNDTILEDWGALPLASAQPQDISAPSEPSRLSEQPHPNTLDGFFTPESNSAPIVEAQGWVTGPRGEVVLTAQAPTVAPQSASPSTPDCHRLRTSSNPLN